jgi:Fur family transcriptional regulator, ferric uptake regulator
MGVSTSLEHMLLAKQVAPTAMRLLVLELLMKQKTAISLNDVEKGLGHVDRITVYRTLKTFEKKGLIHLVADGTVSKYALCADACTINQHFDNHLHFYCTTCGKTSCVPEVKVPHVALPAQYKMDDVSLMGRGVCYPCQALTMQ